MWFLLSACTLAPERPGPAAPVPAQRAPEAPPEPAPEPPAVCFPAPSDPAGVCWHASGGEYEHGACAADGQCCAGAWSAPGACGACTCDEPSGRDGCATGPARCMPPFAARVTPLPDDLRARMAGSTWREGCPVGLDQLALIAFPHWGLDGAPRDGQLVVRADLAPVFVDVLAHAWRVGFPFERVEPASAFGGDDDALMAANVTSAFNCRKVTGGASYSQHSFGSAIDINPLRNPYVSGGRVLPPEGAAWLDRVAAPGVILDPGPIVGAFRRNGFGWGGHWSKSKDYQHFSESGR